MAITSIKPEKFASNLQAVQVLCFLLLISMLGLERNLKNFNLLNTVCNLIWFSKGLQTGLYAYLRGKGLTSI